MLDIITKITIIININIYIKNISNNVLIPVAPA